MTEDASYLPISELDLRAVLRDIKAVISELKNQDESCVVSGLSLSGINSAHPMLKDLFHESLDCPVQLLNPVLMPRISGFIPDDLLVQAGLARLMGLGLGFLPREQLLDFSVTNSAPQVVSSPASSLYVDAIVGVKDRPKIPQMSPLDVEVMPALIDGGADDSFAIGELQKPVSENVEYEAVVSEAEEEPSWDRTDGES